MTCISGSEPIDEAERALSDQLVEFCNQLGPPADLRSWLALVEGCSGPVVYVGPGTGRRAIALAEAGHSLIAIKASGAMAVTFKSKLAESSPEVRERIEFIHGRVEDVSPRDRYQAVLAPSMLLNYAITEPQCQKAFLTACRRHLATGGLLAIELYNPYFLMTEGIAQLRPGPLQPGGRVWMNTVVHRAAVDPWTQRCNGYRLICERFEPGGTVTRYVASPASLAVAVFPRELALLLEVTGFHLKGFHTLAGDLGTPQVGDVTIVAVAAAC